MTVPFRLLAFATLGLLGGCGPAPPQDQAQQPQRDPVASRAASISPSTPATDAANAPRDVPITAKPDSPIKSVAATTAPLRYHPPDLPASDDAAAGAPFPDEVTTFMVDRDGCDHFRGETPYDEERRVYLAQSVAELCTGSDARLAWLRERYATDPVVTAALSGYADRIERTAQPGPDRLAPDDAAGLSPF